METGILPRPILRGDERPAVLEPPVALDKDVSVRRLWLKR